MRRDWGLFAGGVGILLLGATLAVPPLLVYGDTSGCDPDPTDDVVQYGRACDPDAFDRWVGEPLTVAFLAAALTVSLIALAVMHRGLSRPRER